MSALTVQHDNTLHRFLKYPLPLAPLNYHRDNIKIINNKQPFKIIYALHPYGKKLITTIFELPPYRVAGGMIGIPKNF